MKIKWVKAGTLMFLAAYLVFLCTRGWAKDVPIEEMASKMEQDKTITSLENAVQDSFAGSTGWKQGILKDMFFIKQSPPCLWMSFWS